MINQLTFNFQSQMTIDCTNRQSNYGPSADSFDFPAYFQLSVTNNGRLTQSVSRLTVPLSTPSILELTSNFQLQITVDQYRLLVDLQSVSRL